eukprot:scaffold108944_cov38-Attheya_sp.AAC.1
MEKAASIIFEYFAKFGLLIMHIGTGGKKSKTEAVYYPPKLLGKGEIPLVKERDTFTIRDATNQTHELTHLWRNKHIKLGIKVWLYLALPVNTLLWGCESWAISAEAARRLESFHTKSIRKILGIRARYNPEMKCPARFSALHVKVSA